MSSERLVGYTEVCQIFALAGIVSVSAVTRNSSMSEFGDYALVDGGWTANAMSGARF